MEQRKLVRAEKVTGRLLGVVYDGGALGKEVLELLRKRGLRVIFVDVAEAEFPVLEKPDYVVFFATGPREENRLQRDWREAVVTAKRNGAKLFLCLDNVSLGIAERLIKETKDLDYQAKEVKITGEFETREELAAAGGKIVHEVFSASPTGSKLQLTGKQLAKREYRQYTANVSDRPLKHWEYKVPEVKPGSRTGKILAIISLVVIIFFLPFLGATALATVGVVQLRSGEKALVGGQFDRAKGEAEMAETQLTAAANLISAWEGAAKWTGLGTAAEKYYDLMLVGKSAAQGLGHLAIIAKATDGMMAKMVAGTSGIDVATAVNTIKPELAALDTDLGMAEGQWESVSGIITGLSPWMGIAAGKLTDVPQKISQVRGLITQSGTFLEALPEITGQTTGEKKTYLVVLQNSSELRPTGGFIGSYAIVSFDSGRLLDFKINDIYSADGQLRGRIQPPDEILHYLGQPSWFMRDANWAADWPLTAKRLAWFLEKETGEKVSGVWAVSLPAAQKMLTATGPLNLPDLNETVSAEDFYHKAEYTSEINFFPGSTQKKDFLGATAQALLERLTTTGERNWGKLAQVLGQALMEKDIMFYFDAERPQKAIEAIGWGGTIVSNGCTQLKANCLMIVEANVGANKSNFFLSRSITINALIGKGGEIENRVAVRYQNNSPSLTWPGGVYKDFVRFLIPMDGQMTGFDLGDGRKAVVSPVLTAEAMAKIAPDQFLVFKNTELTGKSQGASDSAWLSYGTYFEVPVGQSRTITFSFRPNYRVNFQAREPEIGMVILRQPGSGVDSLDLVVDYPEFLVPETVYDQNVAFKVGESTKLLAFPQKISYNTDLANDKVIKFKFQGPQ